MQQSPQIELAVDPLTICQLVHGLPVGGAEKLVSRIVQQLRCRYRFVIACLDQVGELGEMLIQDGIQVVHVQRRPKFDWKCVRRLQQLFSDERVRLVHAHQCTPFSYALATGVFGGRPPVLLTEHGRFYPDHPSLKRKLFNRFLTSKRDRFVAVGNSVKQALIDNEGLPTHRLQVVYNGIELNGGDDKQSDRSAARAELQVADEEFMVIQVARLDSIKDHKTAVRAIQLAVRQNQRIRLFIVGDGPEKTAIEQAIRAARAEDRVTMLGLRTDVRRLLCGADAFLLTSLSEGVPVTILEAMAAGVPVIATNVGGVPEIIEDSVTGLLVPAADAQGIADALLRMACDPILASSIAAAASQRVRTRFSEKSMISTYDQIYRELSESARIRVRRNRSSTHAAPTTGPAHHLDSVGSR
jgi:sugar transferase (PEP-CTERM/EpsH1 system associated)